MFCERKFVHSVLERKMSEAMYSNMQRELINVLSHTFNIQCIDHMNNNNTGRLTRHGDHQSESESNESTLKTKPDQLPGLRVLMYLCVSPRDGSSPNNQC